MEDVITKIQALRRKASDAASTEAEAAEAAMMAVKLMMKYEIDEDAVIERIQQEGVVNAAASFGKVFPTVLNACHRGIEAATETKVYRADHQMHAVGATHDVEMALYLCELIVGASRRAWLNMPKGTDDMHGMNKLQRKRELASLRIRRESFMVGFGAGLNERLKAIAEARTSARTQGTATGNALVVCKDTLIKAHLYETGVTIRKSRKKNDVLDSDHYAFGRALSGAVNLERPLKSGNDNGRITV